jgi:hypothetical protein
MRWVLGLGTLALGAYSATLIAVEVRVSQDFADYFFTDITGPVRFYAVNTTLAVFLLWSAALIFAACYVCTHADGRHKKERAFYLTQILVFGYLGFDDRFLIHEWLGGRLRKVGLELNDATILIGIGALEVVLLLTLGELMGTRLKRNRRYVYLAALFFALMVAIDSLVSPELIPRLSLEDLSKTWASAFLFMFAWSIYYDKITALKREARPKHS